MATLYGNTNSTLGYWDEAFYKAYQAGYSHILQENNDAYAGLTEMDTIEGEFKAYDFVGTVDLTKKNSRFEDLPRTDVAHNKRWIYPEWYRKRIFIDSEDQIALKADPTSSYMQAITSGIIRIKNDVIHNAFFGAVRGGENPAASASAGDDTQTFYDLAFTPSATAQTGRTIVHDAKKDFTVGGDSSGLTIEKLILAREAMIALHNNPNEKFNIACNQRQISDLLRSAETQSIDTAAVRALQAGTITEYMGFKFVIDYNITLGSSNDIDADTNVYECPVWAKSGIVYAQNLAPTFKLDWHVDKAVWQLSARCGMNAIRLDEDKVLKIECAAV
jgi:hypothetical protein